MYIIWYCACVCAKLLQLCLTLCNPMDPKVALQAPLSMGFSQARILEWVATSFSMGSS